MLMLMFMLLLYKINKQHIAPEKLTENLRLEPEHLHPGTGHSELGNQHVQSSMFFFWGGEGRSVLDMFLQRIGFFVAIQLIYFSISHKLPLIQ